MTEVRGEYGSVLELSLKPQLIFTSQGRRSCTEAQW